MIIKCEIIGVVYLSLTAPYNPRNLKQENSITIQVNLPGPQANKLASPPFSPFEALIPIHLPQFVQLGHLVHRKSICFYRDSAKSQKSVCGSVSKFVYFSITSHSRALQSYLSIHKIVDLGQIYWKVFIFILNIMTEGQFLLNKYKKSAIS